MVGALELSGRTTSLDVDIKLQLDPKISDSGDADNGTVPDVGLQEAITFFTIHTANTDSSVELLLDTGDIGNVSNQIEVEQQIKDVLAASRTVTRGRMRGRRVTAGRSWTSRGASMREVAAVAIADAVRSGADALSGMVPVVRNEPILAAEMARLANITERLSVLGVVALLVAWVAVDQVGEEVMSFVFTAEQVGNVLCNRVGTNETGKDRQAQAKVNTTID